MVLKEYTSEDYFQNKNSFFFNLPVEDKALLVSNSSIIHFEKNELIFREGEKPNGLICLASGKVKIFKEGVGGREQIVRLASPIGFIGYRALFAEENYASSAVTIEDSIVCIIEKENLLKVLARNNDLLMKILRKMATELGFSNNRTVSLTQKHIRGRLAEAILFLKDTYGFDDDKVTLKVYLSREDIANLSNMTTSNAIRTLSALSNEKVIALDGRKIQIINQSKLERISDLG